MPQAGTRTSQICYYEEEAVLSTAHPQAKIHVPHKTVFANSNEKPQEKRLGKIILENLKHSLKIKLHFKNMHSTIICEACFINESTTKYTLQCKTCSIFPLYKETQLLMNNIFLFFCLFIIYVNIH